MNKIDIEIVRDFDGTYYVNMFKNGDMINGLPEYVNYRTLKKEIKNITGFEILPMKALKFKSRNRKQYASFNNYEPIDH